MWNSVIFQCNLREQWSPLKWSHPLEFSNVADIIILVSKERRQSFQLWTSLVDLGWESPGPGTLTSRAFSIIPPEICIATSRNLPIPRILLLHAEKYFYNFSLNLEAKFHCHDLGIEFTYPLLKTSMSPSYNYSLLTFRRILLQFYCLQHYVRKVSWKFSLL